MEEPEQCFSLTLPAAPEKPPGTRIQLIDHGQVLVPDEHLDFINPDLGNANQVSVGNAVFDHMLNRSVDALPAGLEDIGRFFPGQPPCPASQVDLITGGHLFFAIGPRHVFDFHPVNRAGNPTGRVLEEDLEGSPYRHILEIPNWLSITFLAALAALWAFRLRIRPGLDLNHKGF